MVPGGSRWFPVSLLPGGTWITKTWTNRRNGPPSSWLGMASPSTSSRRDEIPKKGIPMGIRADHQGLGAFSAGAKASEKHCWSPRDAVIGLIWADACWILSPSILCTFVYPTFSFRYLRSTQQLNKKCKHVLK